MFSQYNADRNILNSDGDPEIILSPNTLQYYKQFYEGRKRIGSMLVESEFNPGYYYHSCKQEAFQKFKDKFTKEELKVICSSDEESKTDAKTKVNKKLSNLLSNLPEDEIENIIRKAGLDPTQFNFYDK